ncbi:kinase/pyrophosphorylase [Facklamia sp. P12945]|uniref:kinase/pyrophosphorylase n=1 Tax=unclassified Facklamia TaxID=2622293 RepID=UPI003D167BF1
MISDSIGETTLRVAKAVAYQFPYVHILLHKYVFISTSSRLQGVLQEAKNHQAKEAESFCIMNNLHFFNLSPPFTQVVSQLTGKTSQTIGAQNELNHEYFDRINAVEFAMRYADGKEPKIFIEADIILLAVSHPSKTPLNVDVKTFRGYYHCHC